jgi:hypothetical protein
MKELKYHVSCADGKISVKIKIEITFNFRLQRRAIQLVVLVPVGLSSLLRHLQQFLLDIEVSSGHLTV